MFLPHLQGANSSVSPQRWGSEHRRGLTRLIEVKGIRIAKTWTEVDVKIKAAQAHYANKTGFRGRLWHIWRWSADNTLGPLTLATRLVPQIEIVTPVLGAVQLILEAVQTGAKVRGESL